MTQSPLVISEHGGGAVIDKLSYAWRSMGCVLIPVFFGLGCILLTVTIFPAIALVTEPGPRRSTRSQFVVYNAFRFVVASFQVFGFISLEFDGRDQFAAYRGTLIVANHPTLLDVLILMSCNPYMQCVVKPGLWKNPFLRGIVSSAGYIRSDLPAEELIDRCSQALAEKNNLIIFPEGTRTRPGSLPVFLRGFANIATLVGADINTVVITCDPPVLTKGVPWYRTPQRRPHYQIILGKEFNAAKFLRQSYRTLSVRKLANCLETYYREALSNGRPGR